MRGPAVVPRAKDGRGALRCAGALATGSGETARACVCDEGPSCRRCEYTGAGRRACTPCHSLRLLSNVCVCVFVFVFGVRTAGIASGGGVRGGAGGGPGVSCGAAPRGSRRHRTRPRGAPPSHRAPHSPHIWSLGSRYGDTLLSPHPWERRCVSSATTQLRPGLWYWL